MTSGGPFWNCRLLSAALLMASTPEAKSLPNSVGLFEALGFRVPNHDRIDVMFVVYFCNSNHCI